MRSSGRGAATPRADRIRDHRRAPHAPPALWALALKLASASAVALFAAAPTGAATPAPGLCIVVAEVAAGTPLEVVPLDRDAAVFTITYVHSVTRTPVDETYRVDGDGITQTSISFIEPGPGLPTEGAPGEKWERRDGRTVVTMARPLAGIRMRVNPEQQPALFAAGKSYALAQWGTRSIALGAVHCEVKAQ